MTRWGGAVVVALGISGCGEETPAPLLGEATVVVPDLPSLDPFRPPIVTVDSIRAGAYHACALMSDGTARCWGSNTDLELGSPCSPGAYKGCAHPVPFLDHVEHGTPFRGIQEMWLGSHLTCVRDRFDRLWCWGDNHFGQMGIGKWTALTLEPILHPSGPVSELSLSMSAGLSCLTTREDELLCWGPTTFQGVYQIEPIPLYGLDHASSLPPHDPYCVVRLDGRMACRGWNLSGAVGDGTFEVRNEYLVVEALGEVEAVACGHQDVSCALDEAGRVYCWGSGKYLGTGTEEDSALPRKVLLRQRATQLDFSWDGFGCALVEDETVWCWGHNWNGRLGDGTTEHRLSPVQTVGIDDVRSIALGRAFACALRQDRSVWCWGNNDHGQLGTGNRIDSHVPVPVRFDLSEDE